MRGISFFRLEIGQAAGAPFLLTVQFVWGEGAELVDFLDLVIPRPRNEGLLLRFLQLYFVLFSIFAQQRKLRMQRFVIVRELYVHKLEQAIKDVFNAHFLLQERTRQNRVIVVRQILIEIIFAFILHRLAPVRTRLFSTFAIYCRLVQLALGLLMRLLLDALVALFGEGVPSRLAHPVSSFP